MDCSSVLEILHDLPVSSVRCFVKIGSTNVEAAAWALAGAADLSLVIAGEQTAGRGRLGRKWYTPPDAALAFSLVLRPTLPGGIQAAEDSWYAARYTALGAVAVCQTLRLDLKLPALIKWPNDVLLAGRKTAGVLAEAVWLGDQLNAIILGIGVNVRPAAVPPADLVDFPATCVETAANIPVPPLDLLRTILVQLLSWREKLAQPSFIQAWDELLALRGEQVEVQTNLPTGEIKTHRGVIRGLDEIGRLCLQKQDGGYQYLSIGEVHHQAVVDHPASVGMQNSVGNGG